MRAGSTSGIFNTSSDNDIDELTCVAQETDDEDDGTDALPTY